MLVDLGHIVYIETGAGAGCGYMDNEYKEAGAIVSLSPEEVFNKSNMILKVKEPQEFEVSLLKHGQILFTYLHLAASEPLTRGLISSGCTSIAYETITGSKGDLPLLTPMSMIAGRVAFQVGTHYLHKSHGGSGVLLSGAPGVKPGHITIIGAGVVGGNALQMAIGSGAKITVVDKSITRLEELERLYFGKIHTLYASPENIHQSVVDSDLVIGAVLIPGGKAPKVVKRSTVEKMKPGSVIVDVAIDQGGCIETSRPTTHSDPTYLEAGVLHYCVTNMPGSYPLTSTNALINSTFPYLIKLAEHESDILSMLKDDQHLANGLHTLPRPTV